MIKYWKHILFFASYLTILLICMSPDISQKCYGNDTFSLLYGAKFLEIRYPAPLYTFLGWPIANLPFGVDGGNLVLFLSTIPAFLSSICVFLITKKLSDNKFAPWIASATLMGSYVFFSQAIIVELYSLLAFFSITSFLALVYGKTKTSAVLCGLAMACHYITGVIPFIAFLIYSKDFRRIFYLPIVVFLTVFLSYHVFLDRFVWEVANSSSNQLFGIFDTILKAFERGNINDFPQTIWEAISIFVISFGLSIIPILYFMKEAKKSYVFWILLALPIGFILFGGYSRYINIVPFAPFIAVMAGLGVSRISIKHLEKIVLVTSFIMMISLPLFFDIGRTLDENDTTARKMIDELYEVEDGSIIMGIRLFDGDDGKKYSDSLGGNVAVIVEYYNKENNMNLIPIRVNFVLSSEYKSQRSELQKRGVILPERDDVKRLPGSEEGDWLIHISEQVSLYNPSKNVYYYEIIDKETEKCVLVKANSNLLL